MEQITDVAVQQKILLEGLLHLSGICQKHHLRYFLCNGSLLGAVKYRKFIPWDDDADVLMPREDYDKLMRLADGDSPDFRLLCRERDPGWKMPYAKLSHNHTIQKETTADFGCEMGINVDIFPVDSWRRGKWSAKLQAAYCGLLRRFISASLEKSFFSPRRGLTRGILWCIWVFSRACGTEFFIRKLENQRKKGCDDSRFRGCLVWAAYGGAEIMAREQFEEQSMVEFCGHSFTTFRDPDEYLRSLYGDYRKDLPPEKQRSNHALKVYWKEYAVRQV